MTKQPRKPDNGLDIHYDAILGDISGVIEAARRSAARSVNCIMTAAYWLIGRSVLEFEQKGFARAEYGEELLRRLSYDLTSRYGRGFAKSNLYQMRSFYMAFQDIFQTLSGKSDGVESSGGLDIFQTPSGISELQKPQSVQSIARLFPLPWSAYVRLLTVKNEQARKFYETEALRGGWSVRQLDRQINSQFYERTALSRNKAAMLSKGEKAVPEDHVLPEEEIKDLAPDVNSGHQYLRLMQPLFWHRTSSRRQQEIGSPVVSAVVPGYRTLRCIR